jgi:hypothetical protein
VWKIGVEKPNGWVYGLGMETNTNKSKYEILDSMEVVVAEADSFEDAMYAAEKYAPAMIVRRGSGRACYLTN